jgi:hypothetical protein
VRASALCGARVNSSQARLSTSDTACLRSPDAQHARVVCAVLCWVRQRDHTRARTRSHTRSHSTARTCVCVGDEALLLAQLCQHCLGLCACAASVHTCQHVSTRAHTCRAYSVRLVQRQHTRTLAACSAAAALAALASAVCHHSTHAINMQTRAHSVSHVPVARVSAAARAPDTRSASCVCACVAYFTTIRMACQENKHCSRNTYS